MSADLYLQLLGRCVAALKSLPDKPEETAEATLRALWCTAADQPRSAALAAASDLPALDARQMQLLEQLVEQRLAGVPLAYLTGRQHFMGLELLACPQALIPRKQTEVLARVAIERARECIAASGRAVVLDVCTGAGNVALAVAAHVPKSQVYGADISPGAVELARVNAARLGLAEQVSFREGDLLQPFDEPDFLGRIDVLTCNPPYISSAKVSAMPAEIARYEPRLAFDGGPFGIQILERLSRSAPRFLRPGGWLVFEVGEGQGVLVARRMKTQSAYDLVQTVEDDDRQVRVIAARTASNVH